MDALGARNRQPRTSERGRHGSPTGTRLGRYEVLAALGAGGMGDVYRARDTRLDREVAVKILPDAVASDRDRLARFEREARALARIEHPNILAIHDIGEEPVGDRRTTTFAVTELLTGETLGSRLAHETLAWRRAVWWRRHRLRRPPPAW